MNQNSHQSGISRASLDASNALFLEGLYETYQENPEACPETWRSYFSSLETESSANGNALPIHHQAIREQLVTTMLNKRGNRVGRNGSSVLEEEENTTKQAAVQRLINNYRLMGHLRAAIDPLDMRKMPEVPNLDYHVLGLEDKDLGKTFSVGNLATDADYMRLSDIISLLRETYTGSIGVEYMHISNVDIKRWLRDKLEKQRSRPRLDAEEKRHLYRQLVAAEGIEKYLGRAFPGQKRFSLEGGESLIPLLDEIVQQAGSQSVREAVIGMAHRGRLNVLVNIMGKRPEEIFSEFKGKIDFDRDKITGDVKYHKGFSSDVRTPGGPVHLSLAFNPSHLEIINPVVQGSARARQDRVKSSIAGVLPIVIHGDAAIAGQGVAYETANMSDTRAYSVGGTIHIVVNNQIGFTTHHLRDARSATYCTDVGKVVQSPILHVNADDPEAVIMAARIAVEYRMMWHKDIYIDLVCYRRHGHNEGDEPAATQPQMYDVIRNMPTVAHKYEKKLVNAGILGAKEPRTFHNTYRDALESGRPVSYNFLPQGNYYYSQNWEAFLNGRWTDEALTSVPELQLKELGKLATKIPDGFHLHPTVKRIMDDRREMLQGQAPLDWGAAETLAYATLLQDGYGVRMTGQDCTRGTFYHRHAQLHDTRSDRSWFPLSHLFKNQPAFEIYDSVLSEEAVLGFEYGYSTTDPNTLVLWEAQYGDFANGAQVVVDQFISSCEQKWNLFSGIVMMLPHGWEGQGPEHSSARMERFLQLCAQENMQICVPSTPAQMFHLLRRQMVRKLRIPLIIFTPKSMLRKKESYSALEELAEGGFKPVINEVEKLDPKKVKRIVLCAGKVYYELVKKRTEEALTHVAIIRVEQLYPWPYDDFQKAIQTYPHAEEVVWAQEGPRNQEAWYQIKHRLERSLPDKQLIFAGRIPCSAPAGGSMSRHNQREDQLIEEALGLREPQALVPTPSPRALQQELKTTQSLSKKSSSKKTS